MRKVFEGYKLIDTNNIDGRRVKLSRWGIGLLESHSYTLEMKTQFIIV